MSSKTENPRTGDFLLSEANGSFSRENRILTSGDLHAGTVLGRIAGSGDDAGKFVAIAAEYAGDYSHVAAGILWAGADASEGDVAIVTIERAAEVKADALIWPTGITVEAKTAAIAKLEALGIVLR